MKGVFWVKSMFLKAKGLILVVRGTLVTSLDGLFALIWTNVTVLIQTERIIVETTKRSCCVLGNRS